MPIITGSNPKSMRKIFLLMLAVVFALGVDAQSRRGESSLMANAGYQSNYKRFGLGLQYRYVIANNLRIAPDITFFFPKDKVTGLDVDVNFHYVFNFKADGQGFQVYPLAGIGMQNNFYGNHTVTINDEQIVENRDNSTDFALNLGGGITLPLSERSYLNAETKFMFGDKDNVVFMLGYGCRF